MGHSLPQGRILVSLVGSHRFVIHLDSPSFQYGTACLKTGACAVCSFWDTISFSVNGIVFFFAGASAVNFFVR